MTDRAALLIGVPTCDNDLFPALDGVVSEDVRRMTNALRQSGYDVRHCGERDPAGQEPTGNRIRAAIRAAVRTAPPGGVLIIYFSGHGAVLNGEGWLVPQDVYEDVIGLAPDSLVRLVPSDLGDCRARLVLFLVDACRNDLSASLATTPSGGALPYLPDGGCVLINSCQPGERSQYGDDGSYFTQALAEVLVRRSPARTLGEVFREVTRYMSRRAARTDGLAQQPDIAQGQRGMSELEAVVICEGDEVGDAWRRAVEATPIWRRSGAGVDAERIRYVVLDVVDGCAHRWLSARETLRDHADLTDGWSTHDYPVRVLAALDQCLPPDAELSPFELAAAVSAPFLREAALSAGLRLAAGAQPQDFSRTYTSGARSDLEITHAIHEHVCRRAEGLDRRGLNEPRNALAMWLVHRWLAGRSSLWTDPGVAKLTRRVAAGTVSAIAGLTEQEAATFLCVLMQCVDADPQDERTARHLSTKIFDARVRTLGAALWLAGIMAADPRQLPSVVVDHIGVGTELTLPDLHGAVGQSTWRRIDDGMVLYAVCEHPALYGALSDLVRRANSARRVLDEISLDPAVSRSLPAMFHATNVRAEVRDGEPAFETPLLRFQLSDDKVRELLMGRQLYGEPDLAIRELYQNALDACRYRRTRREYLRRTEQALTAWDGTIEMRQGIDENGREYIECTDNGVGMTREILMSTFANAGERFVYRPGFRAEQARWQELDPPLQLIPNSQFGVGVFSYFMLAEEIRIDTRPVSENDVVNQHTHSVRISSSGSLFRITRSDAMPGGGTRVRLYLTGEDRVSVLQTMRRLLWVAEFTVTVKDADGTGDVWQPEQLHYQGTTIEPLKHGSDLWWVPGPGGLIADGLRTNEERYGIVVNLRGQRRPQFTVSRNRLRSWDKEWINQQLHDSMPHLQDWPGLTVSWLWQVTDKSPAMAEIVFGWLLDHDRKISVEGSGTHAVQPLAARIGCLPVDLELLNGERHVSPYDGGNLWLACWRAGIWKGIHSIAGTENLPEPTRPDGFPVVRPLDASVIGRLPTFGGSQYGHPSVDELVAAAVHEDEAPTTRLRRLRRYAIAGLDLERARQIPPVRHVFKEDRMRLEDGVEDAALLIAVAAWAPPGQPPRRAIGGWLASASARLQVPLGEVLRRASKLVPSAWIGPRTEDLGDLVDQSFTWDDLVVFSRDLRSTPSWISSTIPPAHIARLTTKLGRNVGEVLALFDRYAPLGYEVGGRHLYPSDLTSVEREALRYVEETGLALSPLHMLILAGRTSTTVRDVRASLEGLNRSGLLRLPATDPLPDMVPTEDELAIINEHMQEYDLRYGAWVPATGWQAVGNLVRSISQQELAGFDERLARHRRLLEVVDVRRPVTMPEIISVAYWLDYSIAAAIDHYARLFPHTADLSALPPGARKSTVTCHRFVDFETLATELRAANFGHHEIVWTLTTRDIVRGAARSRQPVGTYLSGLEPFRALGAPLPVLSDTDQAALADRVADRYDVAMLQEFDEFGQCRTVDEISPLRLVQVAGRFGWTVLEARQRMASMEPLGLVVHCSVEHCPDEIVHWQDLLALTGYLDGQAPALSGRVSAEHLAAAAADLEETVESVRQRLDRYAALFGFTLVPARVGSDEGVARA